MYEIIAVNENNQKFRKTFDSEYFYNKFLNKAKHSKKIILLSYGRYL